MPRDISVAFETALDDTILVPAYAARFEFFNDPLYAWTGLGTVEWDPGDGVKSWIGLQGAVHVEPIQETSDVRIGSAKFTLSYVPNETLPSLNTAEWKDRDATLYKWLFDADDLSAPPVGGEIIWLGSMDQMQIKVQAGQAHSTLELTVVNELVRMKQSWGAVHNDADQSAYYPGDTSHRFVQSMQNKKIEL